LAHAFSPGEVLTATLLNSNVLQILSGTKTRIVTGTTAWSLSTQSAKDIAVSWGVTLSGTPIVLLAIESGSNVVVACSMNGGPSTTGVTVRIETNGGGNVTQSGLIHWAAIAVP
jgi:hypothetical protein